MLRNQQPQPEVLIIILGQFLESYICLIDCHFFTLILDYYSTSITASIRYFGLLIAVLFPLGCVC